MTTFVGTALSRRTFQVFLKSAHHMHGNGSLGFKVGSSISVITTPQAPQLQTLASQRSRAAAVIRSHKVE